MTPKQCRAFLDRWDELAYHDAKAGRQHAAEGLARVEQLGNPPELHARALAFMGSSLRPSDPRQALAFLDRSLAIYHRHGASPEANQKMIKDETDARRRVSLVHMEISGLGDQGHRDHREKAFAEIDLAHRFCIALGDPEGAARCQLARAIIHIRFEEVVPALHVLLPVLPKLQGVYSMGAAFNIKTALIWARRRGISIPKDLRHLALSKNIRLVRLTAASRERWPDQPTMVSHGRRKKTQEDALWRWNLAILLEDDRRYHEAIREYLTARDDLAELSMPLYAAEITLNIVPLFARFGMWDKVQRVAAEMAQLLVDFPDSDQAVTAYGLWSEALEAEDHEHLKELAAACCTALEQLNDP